MKYEKVITLEVTRVREDNLDEIERIMGVKVIPNYPDWSENDDEDEFNGEKFYGIDFEEVDSETYENGTWIGLWSTGAWFFMYGDYADGSVEVHMDDWHIEKFPSEDAFWASLRKVD